MTLDASNKMSGDGHRLRYIFCIGKELQQQRGIHMSYDFALNGVTGFDLQRWVPRLPVHLQVQGNLTGETGSGVTTGKPVTCFGMPCPKGIVGHDPMLIYIALGVAFLLGVLAGRVLTVSQFKNNARAG
jgi:hypothetical protein